MDYIVARLKEFATWRVIAGLVAGVGGPVISDGNLELAFQVASGALLLWEALRKDTPQ
jgi:hypothetical protein